MNPQACSLSDTLLPDSNISSTLRTKLDANGCFQKVERISGIEFDIREIVHSIEIACRRSELSSDVKYIEISTKGMQT